MKALLKNIWEAPGYTAAGALGGALAAMLAEWAGAPQSVQIICAGLIFFLGAFSGPNK